MTGQNQADYIKYWQLFKGNYAKGINALGCILSSKVEAEEFLENHGGVSVIFGCNNRKDKNSEELINMLIKNEKYLEIAITTLLKPYAKIDINSISSITSILNNNTIMSKIAEDKTAMVAIASSKKMMAEIAKSKTVLRSIIANKGACEAMNSSNIIRKDVRVDGETFKNLLLRYYRYNKIFEYQEIHIVREFTHIKTLSEPGIYYAEDVDSSMDIIYCPEFLNNKNELERYHKENPNSYMVLFGEGNVYIKTSDYTRKQILHIYKMEI